MPLRFTRLLSMLALSALLSGCSLVESEEARLQAEANLRNEQYRRRSYQIHAESIGEAHAAMSEKLKRVARAEWRWSSECDGCDEDLLPKPLKLGQRELEETLELLKQVQPMPLLDVSVFEALPDVYVLHEGKVKMITQIPGPACCCGGESLDLVFYDRSGEYLFACNEQEPVRASLAPNYRTDEPHRPRLMLPDAAYEQLLSLPSSRRARELNEKLHMQIKERRAEEARRAAEYDAKHPAQAPGDSLLKKLLESAVQNPETQRKLQEVLEPVFPAED